MTESKPPEAENAPDSEPNRHSGAPTHGYLAWGPWDGERMNAKAPGLKHSELTEKIIKVFFQVYNELGHGFLESMYLEAMAMQNKGTYRSGFGRNKWVNFGLIFHRGVSHPRIEGRTRARTFARGSTVEQPSSHKHRNRPAPEFRVSRNSNA